MIDFHCHLDLYPNPLSVRNQCRARNISLLSVTTTPSAWDGTVGLANNNPKISTALGLHPQLARARYAELELFDSLLAETPYVGEIGLDGSPEYKPDWAVQTSVFEHILGKCQASGGKVLSIHSRQACSAVLDQLEAFPNSGTPILHWFSGSPSELIRAISLGCWFSVGPAMLRGKKGRSLVLHMPRERVLTESDGPFAQVLGRTVMPWDVQATLEELSAIWAISTTEAERAIATNANRLRDSLKPGGPTFLTDA